MSTHVIKPSRSWIAAALASALCGGSVSGQATWAPANVPFRYFQMYEIMADSATDALYFCGRSSINNDVITDDIGIAVYDGQTWDTLGPIYGEPLCLIRWGDTLVVGGGVISVDSQPFNGCFGYVNGVAVSFGDFGFGGPRRFRILDGELYAVGPFNEVDGHAALGVAKRVGGAWIPVGSTAGGLGDWYLSDVLKYNDQLIVGGALSFDWTSANGIAVLNDTTWEPLGPGLTGNLTYAGALAIYQDTLYLAGGIHIAQGNPGEGILKWTGSDFIPVGTGLQNEWNQPALNVGAYDLKVHNGLLYVSGQFWFAGNIPASGIATWDGANWCGLGGTLDLPVLTFDVYHDTLYVAPLGDADGQLVDCAAKYIGTYPDTCTSTALSLEEHSPTERIEAWIAGDHLILRTPTEARSARVHLYDANGRLVAQGSGHTGRFALHALHTGLHLVHVAGFPPVKVMVP